MLKRATLKKKRADKLSAALSSWYKKRKGRSRETLVNKLEPDPKKRDALHRRIRRYTSAENMASAEFLIEIAEIIRVEASSLYIEYSANERSRNAQKPKRPVTAQKKKSRPSRKLGLEVSLTVGSRKKEVISLSYDPENRVFQGNGATLALVNEELHLEISRKYSSEAISELIPPKDLLNAVLS